MHSFAGVFSPVGYLFVTLFATFEAPQSQRFIIMLFLGRSLHSLHLASRRESGDNVLSAQTMKLEFVPHPLTPQLVHRLNLNNAYLSDHAQ
jgi:hypothetical protein